MVHMELVIEKNVMMKQYNFDIAMSANVSESVVQDMVTAIVEKQTGRQVKSIETNHNNGLFAGFTVIFDAHNKVRPFVPTKEFVVQNWDEH
jgi:predicted sugar kinase